MACYCLCVALAFSWVPWTSDVGYSWLWSKPQPKVIGNDIVAEARQHWKAEYNANDITSMGEKWIQAVQQASAEEKEKLRREAKRAMKMAEFRRLELSHRQAMSDQEVLDWLRQTDNFNSTFPEKANADEVGRLKLLEEWKRTVPPVKEWNERVQYAKMDYRRIGMELLVLTALCAMGFVLLPRRSA